MSEYLSSQGEHMAVHIQKLSRRLEATVERTERLDLAKRNVYNPCMCIIYFTPDTLDTPKDY